LPGDELDEFGEQLSKQDLRKKEDAGREGVTNLGAFRGRGY